MYWCCYLLDHGIACCGFFGMDFDILGSAALHNWVVVLFIAMLCAFLCRHTRIEGMGLAAELRRFIVTFDDAFVRAIFLLVLLDCVGANRLVGLLPEMSTTCLNRSDEHGPRETPFDILRR